MDRTAMVLLLIDEYSPLMQAASITLDDTPTGVQPTLDRVDQMEQAYPGLHRSIMDNLARWYLLDRIVKRLGASMNVGTSLGNYSLRQQFENARALRGDVYPMVAPLVNGALGVPGSAGPVPSLASSTVYIRERFLTGEDEGSELG